jgi:hypothetical protein
VARPQESSPRKRQRGQVQDRSEGSSEYYGASNVRNPTSEGAGGKGDADDEDDEDASLVSLAKRARGARGVKRAAPPTAEDQPLTEMALGVAKNRPAARGEPGMVAIKQEPTDDDIGGEVLTPQERLYSVHAAPLPQSAAADAPREAESAKGTGSAPGKRRNRGRRTAPELPQLSAAAKLALSQRAVSLTLEELWREIQHSDSTFTRFKCAPKRVYALLDRMVLEYPFIFMDVVMPRSARHIGLRDWTKAAPSSGTCSFLSSVVRMQKCLFSDPSAILFLTDA